MAQKHLIREQIPITNGQGFKVDLQPNEGTVDLQDWKNQEEGISPGVPWFNSDPCNTTINHLLDLQRSKKIYPKHKTNLSANKQVKQVEEPVSEQ